MAELVHILTLWLAMFEALLLRISDPKVDIVKETRKFPIVAALSMTVPVVLTVLTLLIGTLQTTYHAEFSTPAFQNESERLSREKCWIQELNSFSSDRTEYNFLFKLST